MEEKHKKNKKKLGRNATERVERDS